MKRLIATLFVVLLIFSPALIAQADSPLADLQRKLSAFMASAGEESTLSKDAPATIQSHGVIISYYADDSGAQWRTGLAITNNSDTTNFITVGFFNMSGAPMSGGTLTLGPHAMKEDNVAAFVQSAPVPPYSVPLRGSIAVFGTAPFIVDRHLGDSIKGGGIGEVQRASKVF